MKRIFSILLAVSLVLVGGCNKKSPQTAPPEPVHKHEHIPPHHGTPVVLGKEEYHVELVLDSPAGKLQAFVLDGELENFIRVQQPSFEVSAKLPEREEVLVFRAIPNNATGETVGDTSLFETQADWLKTTSTFEGVLKELQVRGKAYQKITFNFPKGNDTDEK
jgi:hypothetical protein